MKVGTVVSAEGVSFAYPGRDVLDGVSFEVGAGEFVALAGPNGSGKSTLLRILLGLAEPSAGTVEVLGSPPRRLQDRWRIGYVPQRPATARGFPATAAEVVAAGRLARKRWWHRLDAADHAAIADAMETVDVGTLAGRRLSEMSGGQQQRVLIAKALASEPELLILDEPVAGVDAPSQRRFRDALVLLARDRGAAVLLVSHELGAVADDLDRLAVLKHGRIVFDGPPADLTATGVSLGIHAHDLPLWLEGPS